MKRSGSCRNATGSWSWLVVGNWREWNLEQFQKSASLRRVSIVGGTVFARLIGRPRVLPSSPSPSHRTPFSLPLSLSPNSTAEWLSESDIEDFQRLHFGIARFRGTCFVSCPPRNRAFATLLEAGPRKWGDWERDEERPTTRCRSPVRVIELHGRGVPISGAALSAAFNCVSISSRNSTGVDQTFRFQRTLMVIQPNPGRIPLGSGDERVLISM